MWIFFIEYAHNKNQKELLPMKSFKINIPIKDETVRGIRQATENEQATFTIFKNDFILHKGAKINTILQTIAEFDKHVTTNSDELTIINSITNFSKYHALYYEIINNRQYQLITPTAEEVAKIRYYARFQRNEQTYFFNRLDRSNNGKYYNNLVPIYGNYERTNRPFTKDNRGKWRTSQRKQYQNDGTPRTTAENIEIAEAWQQFEKTLAPTDRDFFINSEQNMFICPNCHKPSNFNYNQCNNCGYEITDQEKQGIKNQMTEIF